jgi:hypothetical protein
MCLRMAGAAFNSMSLSVQHPPSETGDVCKMEENSLDLRHRQHINRSADGV